MSKTYNIKRDNNTNVGIRYTFVNGKLTESEVVKTGLRKKAELVITELFPRILKETISGNVFHSEYNNIHIISDDIVRVEDTPEKLVIILNDNGYMCFEGETYLPHYMIDPKWFE